MTNEHDNQGAREALVEQLAEALRDCIKSLTAPPIIGTGGGLSLGATEFDMARAVLPLVAAQVEAAVSVVRAERVPRATYEQMCEEADREMVRAESAETDLRALREKVAKVEALHVEVTHTTGGHELRTPLCQECGAAYPCHTLGALSDPTALDQKGGDHAFLPVRGHSDDDECTHRSDGTDETYCGRPEAEHEWSLR